MYRIDLETLWCGETQGMGSEDEARLEVYVDSVRQVPPLRRKMDEREIWPLQKSYEYEDRVVVELWEEDRGEDDLVGKKVFGKFPRVHQTEIFDQAGGHYRLRYSITAIQDIPHSLTEEALKRFERSTKPSMWPKIDKVRLIDNMRFLIRKPHRVEQGQVDLCGPAAIVYELIRQHPSNYVQICQELYETGQFEMRGKTVKPSRTLRNSGLAAGTTEGAWILTATLRDVENVAIDIDHDLSALAGVTNPWEMKGWIIDLLGYRSGDVKSLWLNYGEMDAMRRADQVWKGGGVAFICINSDMINGASGSYAEGANHYIAYAGDLHIDDPNKQLSFRYFSWGDEDPIIKGPPLLEISKAKFKRRTWWIVYGE